MIALTKQIDNLYEQMKLQKESARKNDQNRIVCNDDFLIAKQIDQQRGIHVVDMVKNV